MSKVSRGFVWSSIDRFSIQGFSFLFSILIARLVSPSAYGLVAMVQVFLSFSQVFIDSGFANALIQKKNRTDIDYCTVFIFNLCISLFLYVVLFLAAPWIADFYEQSELEILIRVLSLTLVFSSLSIVQRSRLTIDLDFKKQAKAGIISVLISGTVGVFCAYQGLGVWALVIQSVLSQFSQSMLLMLYSRWIPKLIFSNSSFRKLFAFGSKLLMINVLTSITINAYNLLIGKYYTSADLGYYNRAFTLAQYPSSNISYVMMRIVYPVECELQDDRERLIEAYYKYMRLSCFIIFPLMALVSVLSEPLLGVVLTDKWVPAAIYLSIMSMAFILYPYIDHMGQLLLVIGKSGLALKWVIVKRMISIIVILLALPYGTKALALSLVVSNVFEVLISAYLVSKEFSISIGKQISVTSDIWLVSLVSAIVAFLGMVGCDSYLAQLLTGGLAGCIAYIGFCFLFRLEERKVFTLLWQKVNDKLKV